MQLVPSPTVAVLYAIGWVCGWFLLWRLPRTVRPRPGAPRRAVAVVVPVEGDGAWWPDALAALEPQLREDDELVVVSSRSADIADERPGGVARAVRVAEPPGGWTERTHACAEGAGATTAPLLVFVDSDVRAAPGLLDVVQSEQARRGGVVSVRPWHAVERPVEHLSLFFDLTSLAGSGACSPLRDHSRSRVAYGSVLAVDRATYERAGGHAGPAVRGAIADDLALARAVGKSATFAGRHLASFRRYPDGARALVRGWTKSIATGVAAVRWWVVLLLAAWVLSLALGPVTTPAFYLTSAAQVWVQGRRAGRYGPVSALLYPALLAFFLAVLAWSVALTASGHAVLWRGRRVVSRSRA